HIFFSTHPPPTEIYTLSLHDALPISDQHQRAIRGEGELRERAAKTAARLDQRDQAARGDVKPLEHALEIMADLAQQPMVLPARRSEEHTSELQSRSDLVCRLLLEKKK